MIKSITDYLRVPAATFRYRLLPYHLLAGAISLALGVLLVYGSLSWGDDLGRTISEQLPWSDSAGWLSTIASWVGRLATLALSLILYKYIALICLSPIMGPLSERVEKRYSGNSVTIDQGASLVSSLLRGIRIAVRNITRELLLSLGLFIVGFIPGMAIITTPLLFIVQAYYAGFGNMDYYMERHYDVRGSARYVREHRLSAIGNGSVYLLILAIPFVGFLIAPALGATAATITILDRETV